MEPEDLKDGIPEELEEELEAQADALLGDLDKVLPPSAPLVEIPRAQQLVNKGGGENLGRVSFLTIEGGRTQIELQSRQNQKCGGGRRVLKKKIGGS